MASGNFLLDKGYRAAAAITKFYAVKFSAQGTVTPVTAIDDEIAGFAQYDVATAEITAGKGASVRVLGITEAVASGAIAVGDVVTMDIDGRVSTYASASGKRIVGKCVGDASTNAGDRISLLINQFGSVA